MESAFSWGTELIFWLQRFSPALDPVFVAFTLLGEEGFFMLLLPLVYWSVDRRTGMRLTVVFLVSAYLNAAAKAYFDLPRPFAWDSRVRRLYPAGGAGFPSGHAQGAVVVWGYLAWSARKSWAWIPAAALMLFIALSRIYLGVHFPLDILGGYALGGLVLGASVLLGPSLERWIGRQSFSGLTALSILAPAVLLVAAPQAPSHAVTTASALLGMGLGFSIENRRVRFDSGGTLGRRAARFAVGIGLLFPLVWALEKLGALCEPSVALRILRYSVLGLVSSAGMPWLFVRLGLAARREREVSNL